MSIFPTKILLATDGSEEATLAADAAASLSASMGSELHVLTVGPEYPYYELPEAPARFEEIIETQKREAREVLERQVARIEESGAAVEEAYLRMGERPDQAIVDLAPQRASEVLGSLRRWMEKNGRAITIVLCFVFGVFFLIRGLWGA